MTYVAAWGPPDDYEPKEADPGDEPPEREAKLDTMPWNRWKHIQANELAANTALKQIRQTFDEGRISHSIRGSPDDDFVTIYAEIPVGDDGSPPAGAPISVDELAAETPAEVDVTYKLGIQTFETTKELFVIYKQIRTTY